MTQIVGIRSYWLTFSGVAAHAGAQPMDQRRDAVWGASEFIQRARAMIIDEFTPGVMNVGQIHTAPNAFNIVPSEARLALEFRHGDSALLDTMETRLIALAHETAARWGLGLTAQPLDRIAPAPMSAHLIAQLERAASDLGLRSTKLFSFAGHDAQSMSRITESALFFVPSKAGVSHHPTEYTAPQDCLNAANVLLGAILGLIEQFS